MVLRLPGYQVWLLLGIEDSGLPVVRDVYYDEDSASRGYKWQSEREITCTLQPLRLSLGRIADKGDSK